MKKRRPTIVRKPEAIQSPDKIQERIRQRAYELYELRGREDGHDFDDWLTAESEVARGSGQ